MRKLLLFLGEATPFDTELVSRILVGLPGVAEVRHNPGEETLIEVDYFDDSGSSIIRLNRSGETISLSWFSDSALHASLLIQKDYPEKIRVLDLDYNFDLALSKFRDVETFKKAIMRNGAEN